MLSACSCCDSWSTSRKREAFYPSDDVVYYLLFGVGEQKKKRDGERKYVYTSWWSENDVLSVYAFPCLIRIRHISKNPCIQKKWMYVCLQAR